MIKLPTDITPSDVRQWLEGGYFFIDLGDGPQIRSLIFVGDNSAEVRDPETEEGEIVTFNQMFPHWPMCGAINYDGGFALYVQRLPRRQYRRTYNSRCVRICVPGLWQCLRKHKPSELRIGGNDPVLLRNLFIPRYPEHLDGALMELRDKVSVAVNPHLVLVGFPKTRVYYRNTYAGRLLDREFFPDGDHAAATRAAKIIGGLNANR